MTGRKQGTVEDRFWKKVEKGPGCWLWKGCCFKGYGRFNDGKRTVRAHRFAYQTLIGPIPEGLEPDHICRNRSCVNPAHLDIVTSTENKRRGLAGKINNNCAAKTHCPRGHPYDESNTYVWQGKRHCKICHKESNSRWQNENRTRR